MKQMRLLCSILALYVVTVHGTTPLTVANDAKERFHPGMVVPTAEPSCQDATTTSSWRMQPVRSIKVRVQGNVPQWDSIHQLYVSEYGHTMEEKRRGVLDTMNMASVEGALKYVQSECIDLSNVTQCQRKNNVQYVVFYDTIITQPTPALRKYASTTTAAPEHCPFVAMDRGQCTSDPVTGTIPLLCDEYTGEHGASKLGFCVSGQKIEDDPMAPYPDTYWYSMPNSCPQQVFANKTDACRTTYAGGMCPLKVVPDGKQCTFTSTVLGWVLLDDVVGITNMIDPITKQQYANYTAFCQAGGIEYQLEKPTPPLVLKQSIEFWKDPGNPQANAKRAQRVVQAYTDRVAQNATSSDGGRMQPLPSVQELTRQNPPCYLNTKQCADAPMGCRRTMLSQICQVCAKEMNSPECVKAPKGFQFSVG